MAKTMVLWMFVASEAGFMPTPAFACRQLQYPTQLSPTYSNAAIVRITQSDFVGDQSRFRAWRASADLFSHMGRGSARSLYEFGGATVSAGCPPSKPEKGELWVLYFEGPATGQPVEVMPLLDAKKIDPRLKRF
jgi:hypothetical protein